MMTRKEFRPDRWQNQARAASPKKRDQRVMAANRNRLTGAARSSTSKPLAAVLCLTVVLTTLAVYARTYRYGFIAYDDNEYVYENLMVKEGLTASGFVWAFTAFINGNWHPVTLLSHMSDCQIFGMNAGAHHVVNVAIHLASTWLLFILLVRMTHQPWRSVLVAGIFALHPLHVESVVWISERKDVLSAFFFILALLLYVRYVERSTRGRYAAMASVFALGLMAKPMLVTLPFVLLLLDFWPLKRLEWPPKVSSLKRHLLEKAPLFAMVAVSCVLTFLAQRSSGSVVSIARLPFSARLANAAIAYLSYIGKAFWPMNLAVLYPSVAPRTESALAAFAALSVLTLAAALLAKRFPHLLIGWLWYLGMLVPVIGLVQVGNQAMADRYTYLPMIGLSLALIWSAADLIEDKRTLRFSAAGAAGAGLILFAIGTYRQVAYWKDSRTIFEHTLAVTTENCIIHNNLGVTLADKGGHEEAVAHYRQALVIEPYYAEAHANLGKELLISGKLGESLSHLNEALRIRPDFPAAHADIGILLAAQGNFEASREHLEALLRAAPRNAEGHSNLCLVLQRLGRLEEAIAHCNEALRLKPDFHTARINLGTALAAQGKKDEAAAEFSRVLAANPGHPAARAALQQLQNPAAGRTSPAR